MKRIKRIIHELKHWGPGAGWVMLTRVWLPNKIAQIRWARAQRRLDAKRANREREKREDD